jgi:ribosome-binding factor A
VSTRPKASARHERVADEIRDLLRTALLTEVQDERLRMVQIHAVTVAQDLSQARVWWSELLEEESEAGRQRLGAALQRAHGFLRTWIARQMRIRAIPDLHFVYDESLERGRRMEALLQSIDIPSEDPPGHDG